MFKDFLQKEMAKMQSSKWYAGAIVLASCALIVSVIVFYREYQIFTFRREILGVFENF